jgi:nickel-dependent lactate racemase
MYPQEILYDTGIIFDVSYRLIDGRNYCMEIKLGYGKEKLKLEVPDKNLSAVLIPNQIKTNITGELLVRRALEHPIGSDRLENIVHSEDKIVIITSDITRPLPSYKLIPPVLDQLNKAGAKQKNITIVFALGSHRRHTVDEMKSLVGEEIYRTVQCVDADSKDIVHMGTTKNGTPVDVTRVVAEADVRIALGNIEYHYFAGYSGGAKAIMPGCSTREAIQKNHSKMVSPDAYAGKLEGNPVREDIEESILYCPIDFIVNVVLNEKKEIVCAVAGDYIEAHREGCSFLDRIYKTVIKEKADIVIVTQGGYPKDLNLYQTQKALDNAKHAVKEYGIIILAGACNEGLGEETFEKWMREAGKPDDLIERIKKDFKLGGHKAAAIALVLNNARIFLVSEMKHDFVKSIFMEPYSDLQKAFDDAFLAFEKNASVIVMPYGGSTLPVLDN